MTNEKDLYQAQAKWSKRMDEILEELIRSLKESPTYDQHEEALLREKGDYHNGNPTNKN